MPPIINPVDGKQVLAQSCDLSVLAVAGQWDSIILGDGSHPLTANWSIGAGFHIISDDPTAPQHLATKAYVDASVTTGAVKADGSVPLTADWNAGAFNISAADPVFAQNLVTLGYLQSIYITANTADNRYLFQDGSKTLTATWNVGAQVIENVTQLGINVVGPTYALDVGPNGNANLVQFTGIIAGSTGEYLFKTDSAQLRIDNGFTIAQIAIIPQNISLDAIGVNSVSIDLDSAGLGTDGVSASVTIGSVVSTFRLVTANSIFRVVDSGSSETGLVQVNSQSALLSAQSAGGDAWAIASISTIRGFYVNGSAVLAGSVFFADVGNSRVGVQNTTPQYSLDIAGNVRITGSNKLWFGGTAGSADGEVSWERGYCPAPNGSTPRMVTNGNVAILGGGAGDCGTTCAALYVAGGIYSPGRIAACTIRCCCASGFITSGGYSGVTGSIAWTGNDLVPHTLSVQDGIVIGIS